ncbi:MAG: glutamate--tRNA ligase [Desulfatiglandales bacterium]
MTQGVVTRFPPSPTGYLHLGGARTALFNWLFARKHKGKFILRIEDTDRERSTEEYARDIIESLKWLGIDWDEGPYFQSQRFHIYQGYIERLLEAGNAYYCYCTQEELERKRQEAMERGLKPKYDLTCREKDLPEKAGAVVRLKSPLSGVTTFRDLVRGVITVPNEELDDLILRRSDGTPTYHLAVVADDIELGVTHIIRGDDHLNNTPRQIAIYRALGLQIPHYAHVPMILGPDKKRLSKRHGATSVMAYKEMGYLPMALLNGLVRIGWSYGDQEKFTLPELVEKFSLEGIGKSPGVFNQEKILDLNGVYIRESDEEYLLKELIPFLEGIGIREIEREGLIKAIRTLKPRSKTLVEMAEGCRMYFERPFVHDRELLKRFLTPEVIPILHRLRERLSAQKSWDIQGLEDCFKGFLDEGKIKLKVIAQPLRVILTNRTASPGLFEVMDVLGKEETLRRIDISLLGEGT